MCQSCDDRCHRRAIGLSSPAVSVACWNCKPGNEMDKWMRKVALSRPLMVGSAVVYGVIEFVALRRSTVLARQTTA